MSTPPKTPWLPRAVCLFLFAAFAAPSVTAGSRVVPRAGIAYAPAFVCLATDVLPSGELAKTRVIRRSGNLRSDRMATRHISNLRLAAPPGASEEHAFPSRTLYALVRMHSTGQLAYRLFEAEEALPNICREEHVSVERDRAINAADPVNRAASP